MRFYRVLTQIREHGLLVRVYLNDVLAYLDPPTFRALSAVCSISTKPLAPAQETLEESTMTVLNRASIPHRPFLACRNILRVRE